jgi:hypothetical protein
MAPLDVARALRVRLAAELRLDLASVERRALAVSKLAASPLQEEEAIAHMRSLALAFELERFYTAVETALERAIQGLDGAVPRGAHWHAELLHSASVAVPGFRPALLTAESAAALRELLGFRHFARHSYDAEPDSKRLVELAAQVAIVASAWRVSMPALFAELEGA